MQNNFQCMVRPLLSVRLYVSQIQQLDNRLEQRSYNPLEQNASVLIERWRRFATVHLYYIRKIVSNFSLTLILCIISRSFFQQNFFRIVLKPCYSKNNQSVTSSCASECIFSKIWFFFYLTLTFRKKTPTDSFPTYRPLKPLLLMGKKCKTK